MFNKKWKMIAAFAASFSLVLSAGGLGTLASSTNESGTKAESTLDIAGGAQENSEEAADSGSLLDLAQSMDTQEEAAQDQDGLLELIDNEEAAQAEEVPAAAEDAQAEEAPAAAEDAQAEPAPEADAQAEPAPEEAPAEEAPAEEGAQLQTAPAEEAAQEEAQAESEAVNYEKLTATGSVTDGITTLDVSALVESTMPSIVSVTASSVQTVRSYFSSESYEIEGTGTGSGIIISQNDTELLIATNYHITHGAKDLTVCFSADAEDEKDLIVPAVLKGETSRDADIAVLAVKLSDIKPEIYSQLKVATLGSSDALKVGEAAIVIGNALGFGQTVSTGIISALNRETVTEIGTYREFMTDASINLGCSGGAILNSKGEVVGIVNAKDVAEYAEGMGYGLPIDTVIPILQNMINRETREVVENHGYLGITVVPVSEEASSMYDMPAGAYVYEVSEGSAAELAGIEKGNIITDFDGIAIGSSDDLVNQISYYEAGETVKVTLQVPDGSSYVTKEVEVTLQEGEEDESSEENKEENAAPDQAPEGEDNSQSDYGMPGDDYGYYYDQDMDQGYGYDDPFSWFFGNGNERERGNNDGWGSFYFGN